MLFLAPIRSATVGGALTRRPFVDRVGNRRVTDDFVSPRLTLIESCFSVFQALKGKDRSSLGDGRVLEALLSREAVDVFANGAVGFDELRLRDDSRNHRVPW